MPHVKVLAKCECVTRLVLLGFAGESSPTWNSEWLPQAPTMASHNQPSGPLKGRPPIDDQSPSVSWGQIKQAFSIRAMSGMQWE